MSGQRFDERADYGLDGATMNRLAAINTRLFWGGRHLTPDERRDLANLMHVLLGQAVRL